MSVPSAAAYLWIVAALLAVASWFGISLYGALGMVAGTSIFLMLAVLYDEWRRPERTYPPVTFRSAPKVPQGPRT